MTVVQIVLICFRKPFFQKSNNGWSHLSLTLRGHLKLKSACALPFEFPCQISDSISTKNLAAFSRFLYIHCSTITKANAHGLRNSGGCDDVFFHACIKGR